MLNIKLLPLTGFKLQISGFASDALPTQSQPLPFSFYESVNRPIQEIFYNLNSSARLGPTDADIVDVIHTDGNARYLDYIPQVNAFLAHLASFLA